MNESVFRLRMWSSSFRCLTVCLLLLVPGILTIIKGASAFPFSYGTWCFGVVVSYYIVELWIMLIESLLDINSTLASIEIAISLHRGEMDRKESWHTNRISKDMVEIIESGDPNALNKVRAYFGFSVQ